jgi:hypothetical protein
MVMMMKMMKRMSRRSNRMRSRDRIIRVKMKMMKICLR